MRAGNIKVLFNSTPVEFQPESVVLQVNGAPQDLPNDYVWIFAGGTQPSDFLRKIGVGFGKLDLTVQASNQARQTIPPEKKSSEFPTVIATGPELPKVEGTTTEY